MPQSRNNVGLSIYNSNISSHHDHRQSYEAFCLFSYCSLTCIPSTAACDDGLQYGEDEVKDRSVDHRAAHQRRRQTLQ